MKLVPLIKGRAFAAMVAEKKKKDDAVAKVAALNKGLKRLHYDEHKLIKKLLDIRKKRAAKEAEKEKLVRENELPEPEFSEYSSDSDSSSLSEWEVNSDFTFAVSGA